MNTGVCNKSVIYFGGNIMWLFLFFTVIACSCGKKKGTINDSNPISSNSENVHLKLSTEQMRLGNIKIETVQTRSISTGKTFSGIVALNQNKSSSIISWLNGRIEKLYFKAVGEMIQNGQPLYELYSEQLIATQKDYLIALQQQNLGETGLDYKQLADNAKQKLLLWGMSEKQINELKKSKQTKNVVTIFSTYAGIVSEVITHEGDYVMEGAAIFKMNDLSSIWVDAQLYTSEIASVSAIKEAEVIFPSLSNKKVYGKISFVNPELIQNSKIDIARIEIPNSSQLFKPGMQAYVILYSNPKKAIAIPSNAILRDDKGATAWVQNNTGYFEPRMVFTGIESSDYTEIVSGLENGEKVVISGAYLLQSEYIFKNGADPMAGMKM